MVLPFEHVSEPDATGDSSSENYNQFQPDSRLNSGLSRMANASPVEPLQDCPFGKRWSACS
jgi:hypothetical protein